MADRIKRPLLMVAPEWPKYDGGYSLALHCALKLYERHFFPIAYLGVSRRSRDSSLAAEFPHVRFYECRRPTWSHARRFIRSVAKRTPAILEDYPREEIARLADQAVHDLRHEGSPPPCVIAEDALVGWLLAFRWPGRKQTRGFALRSHNVLGELFEDFSREGPWWRRWAWSHEVRRVQRLEAETLAAVDTIWTITDCDEAKYLDRYGRRPDGIIDFGITPPAEASAPATPAPNVLYLGSVDLRKGHGMKQFIDLAWHRVRAEFPTARLILGGRGTERYSNPMLGIEGQGFVDDERQFYTQGMVYINPQLRGSGIKIKSIMAMFAGRALVTTPKGAEGVRARAGEDFLLATPPSAMAENILRLLHYSAEAHALGLRARQRAVGEYSLDAYYRRTDAVVAAFAARL